MSYRMALTSHLLEEFHLTFDLDSITVINEWLQASFEEESDGQYDADELGIFGEETEGSKLGTVTANEVGITGDLLDFELGFIKGVEDDSLEGVAVE